MNVMYAIMDIIKNPRFYHSEKKKKIVNIICTLVTHLGHCFSGLNYGSLSLFLLFSSFHYLICFS